MWSIPDVSLTCYTVLQLPKKIQNLLLLLFSFLCNSIMNAIDPEFTWFTVGTLFIIVLIIFLHVCFVLACVYVSLNVHVHAQQPLCMCVVSFSIILLSMTPFLIFSLNFLYLIVLCLIFPFTFYLRPSFWVLGCKFLPFLTLSLIASNLFALPWTIPSCFCLKTLIVSNMTNVSYDDTVSCFYHISSYIGCW